MKAETDYSMMGLGVVLIAMGLIQSIRRKDKIKKAVSSFWSAWGEEMSLKELDDAQAALDSLAEQLARRRARFSTVNHEGDE